MRQANELWEAGNHEAAVKVCYAIIERGAGNLETYLMLGEYTCQSGDAGNAVAYFRQALLFDEESLQAHVGLIRALTKNGQRSEAESHLENIKIKDPELAGLIVELVNEGSV